MRSRRVSLCCATGSLALAAALQTPASAQSEVPEADDDTIIVTAQRREADLQDVPAAVTAISAEEITEQNIFDVTDLQYQVPNISIAAGTGTANSARIFLRGVGEDESRGAVDPAVAIYVDGIYIGRNVGALFDVVDLAQIEVLRGPQGTLYGRNASGGAIKLVSKKPDFENSMTAGLTIGNEGRVDLR
ncbi:MAG: TonB-dependent receptor plug domain-containing protein, partial [Parvularcula sp.]|nr:TonB-dependent receptor plug domain-containing protein [Parvularcula sp.]